MGGTHNKGLVISRSTVEKRRDSSEFDIREKFKEGINSILNIPLCESPPKYFHSKRFVKKQKRCSITLDGTKSRFENQYK